jgi:hypothetical protein
MDNLQAHRDIHIKNKKKRDEICPNGLVLEMPRYYGEVLFEKIHENFEKSVEDSASFILSDDSNKVVPDNLPPMLSDLLSLPKEELLAKLIEYYTRVKMLSLVH